MKNIRNQVARIMLSLVLTIALAAPMAMPVDVFASSSAKYATAETQDICGLRISFGKSVISDTRLPAPPAWLKVTGKKKSIKLSWSGVAASTIDGYYILRRDLKGNTWRIVATVSPKATTYTDKKAKTKNKFYRYSVIAFKKVSGKIMVSTPSGWAGALTTRSKKKNVKSVTVSNLANVSIIMAGSCAQTYLTFPKKAYSKYIRWWSGNENILKVSNSGLITAVAPGTANVYVRTHTGAVQSFPVKVSRAGTAQAMIDTFNIWTGYSRINGKQKGIIDIYNSITPWPKGYKMKYYDAWCDATVTAAAIKTGNVDKIGRECSVPRHIKIFKKLGIWQEDGTVTPNPGDIIVYSWNKFKQPNNASASHIGIVADVRNGKIIAIEGNRGIGVVATREIPVGWGCIRGFATPHYAK